MALEPPRAAPGLGRGTSARATPISSSTSPAQASPKPRRESFRSTTARPATLRARPRALLAKAVRRGLSWRSLLRERRRARILASALAGPAERGTARCSGRAAIAPRARSAHSLKLAWPATPWRGATAALASSPSMATAPGLAFALLAASHRGFSAIARRLRGLVVHDDHWRIGLRRRADDNALLSRALDRTSTHRAMALG